MPPTATRRGPRPRGLAPQGLELRRDDLPVGRRPREQPGRPRKGVERLDRLPGNRRVVVRRVAPNELGDKRELRRRKMPFRCGGGERGIALQRGLRRDDRSQRGSDRLGAPVDPFLARDKGGKSIVPRSLRPIAATRVDHERANAAAQSDFRCHAVRPEAVDLARG